MKTPPSGTVFFLPHGGMHLTVVCSALTFVSAISLRGFCGPACQKAKSFLQATPGEASKPATSVDKPEDVPASGAQTTTLPPAQNKASTHGALVPHRRGRRDLQQGANTGPLKTLLPFAWAAVGPVSSHEDFTDPLVAFGGIQAIAARAPAELAQAMQEVGDRYKEHRNAGHNHNETLQALGNASHPNGVVQAALESFPAEHGAGGRTVWALAFMDNDTLTVSPNLTEAALQARGPNAYLPYGVPPQGWAFGDFALDTAATVLVRCSSYFMIDKMEVMWTPDSYNDGRSVFAFHMTAGSHRIFVRFQEPEFTCDIFEDSAAARENVTGVVGQAGEQSPLVMMADSMVSDVVDGHLPSPHVAIPVLNVGKMPVTLQKASLVDAPEGLLVELDDSEGNRSLSQVPIASGQAFILRLALQQSSPLPCPGDGMNLTIALTPQGPGGEALPISTAVLTASCRPSRGGGYRVTFPEFDGSIQHMWVAPPNVSKLENGKCPTAGCPVMVSLHGADVPITENWGHTYSLGDEAHDWPFPYPAWLVQPSNRYHWGTDWESQGYDNARAALEFVSKYTPGLSSPEERSKLLPDLDRLLVTGHSMGGHGCLVFSAHEPDRLLASDCNSCWTSQRRYGHLNIAPLRDYSGNGVIQARMSEYDADFLSRNLVGVPLKLVYGDGDDNVPPSEPRYMQELVDSFSGNASSVDVTELENTSHWYGQNIPELVSFYERIFELPKGQHDYTLPALPETFEFAASSPSDFGTKGNLKLLQLADASKPGRFFVRRCANSGPELNGSCGPSSPSDASASSADSLWYVETSNVRRFRFLERPVRGRPLPESLVLDGTFFNKSDFEDGSPAHFCMARAASQGRKPVWAVCKDGAWEAFQRGGPGNTSEGPLANVLRRAPVCIVHGDGARLESVYLANKLYFISRYAIPIVDASSSVNASSDLPWYCADANLIFMGHVRGNSVALANSCSFPYVRMHETGKGFTLNGHSYKAPATGLLALGRLRNGRLALLVHGTDAVGLSRAVSRVPVASQVDSSDFMVLGPDAGWKGLGGVLAAGYLDHLWRPSAVGSWAEPEHSVKLWSGVGFDDSQDNSHCAEETQNLEQSDLELMSFVPSFALQATRASLWPLIGATVIAIAGLV